MQMKFINPSINPFYKYITVLFSLQLFLIVDPAVKRARVSYLASVFAALGFTALVLAIAGVSCVVVLQAFFQIGSLGLISRDSGTIPLDRSSNRKF